ncbi:MAG: AI-2E family transporter [Planctomycetota bacterium]|nr:AI-2E family transporter [Planctomycetota bacterium]
MATADQPAKSVWILASIAVVVGGLFLAKGVLVPLTLAVLLSFLLSPVCDWLERRGLGRIPAVFATVIVGGAIFGAATWTAVAQMSELAPRVPEYQKNIHDKLHLVNERLASALHGITAAADEMGKTVPAGDAGDNSGRRSDQPYSVRLISNPLSPWQVLSGTFGTVLEGLGAAGVVLLLVIFFLIRREDLRDRFVHLIGRSHLTVTTQALEDAATRVSRYLSTQFLLNLGFGVTIAVGLFWIGVPNALLWGILATTLRFIPYLGAPIAAAMPVALAAAITTDWIAPLATLALFLVVELVISNVVEPWLYGKHTGISAVAVLVAAVFWTWLWGSVGLLLATPLTVCLLVLGKHVPQLAFLNILLGNEPVFEVPTRLYQRLLAGDLEEAAELIEDALKRTSLAEVYDTVLLPVLGFAEADRHHGEIDESRRIAIYEGLKETIEELGERPRETTTTSTADASEENSDLGEFVVATTLEQPCILIVPARDDADELAAAMLAQILKANGYKAEIVSKTVLAGELSELIAARNADVVCISAMAPGATQKARYVCKRLRDKFPEQRLIVGLWNDSHDLATAAARIGCLGGVRVVDTLFKASEQVRAVLQPLLIRHPITAEPMREQRALAETGV